MVERLNKILYVEDDIDIARVAMMTMEEIGNFHVKHCSSGQEALEEIAHFAPQLIIMDMMMPEMDGLETMILIKKMQSGKNIPVIFMTAKAQNHEQELYLNNGAIGVILKPFDPMTLCDIINNLWQTTYGT